LIMKGLEGLENNGVGGSNPSFSAKVKTGVLRVNATRIR